jgi:hypothetical protein
MRCFFNNGSNVKNRLYQYKTTAMKIFVILITLLYAQAYAQTNPVNNLPMPNTGISGLYEVMLGSNNAQYHIKYFAQYGFTVVDSGSLTANQALTLYGVNSALKSYRLQNGEVDSHGLLRILAWDKPTGNGVGYSIPETIGSRMAVMKTNDIVRIADVYQMLRTVKWLGTEPFFDDPLRINANAQPDFFKRPVGVRENAIYGEWFTHVFFQRYGYQIPGYGTINSNAPLKTSEFTHHDFFIKVDSMEQLNYLQTALGLKMESKPTVDGDWLKGPKVVFMMPDGYSHWYQGIVSPNNICGKLKFFMPRAPKPDRSANQKPGELGITLHSFYVPKLAVLLPLLKQHKINHTSVLKNELGEDCIVFKGIEGNTWQIIEKNTIKNKPMTKVEFVWTND